MISNAPRSSRGLKVRCSGRTRPAARSTPSLRRRRNRSKLEANTPTVSSTVSRATPISAASFRTPFAVLALHEAYDLERVEVLKGPQGKLFGQNATGGAINFIAAKPTKSFEAVGDITYGRFNRFEGNAYISGPLSSTPRGRVAISGAEGGDLQTSISRPNDKNGASRYLAGRAIDRKSTRLNSSH